MDVTDAPKYPPWLTPAILALLIFAGIWLRLPLPSDSEMKGFDESVYVRYVTVLKGEGLGVFNLLCEEYLRIQPDKQAFLPPTRVLFLSTATALAWVTNQPVLESIRGVSSAAACLMLVVGAAWAWRLGGAKMAIGVTALLACAPTQIHMAHRALIDGFFALWALLALWGLWEALQSPRSRAWLALYGGSLAAMVLTKENAAFVFVAICVLLLANHWLRLGTATAGIYAVTAIGPACGALILISTAGSLSTLLAVYRLNVEKSMVLPYGIITGDGPWFRYLVDLLLVSPVVLLLAIAAVGQLRGRDRAGLYLTIFIVGSMAFMSQVKQGMNLRYGNMWDMPLRWLAFAQVQTWVVMFTPRLQAPVCALFLTAICGVELVQYNRLFGVGEAGTGPFSKGLYDPTTEALVRKLDMVKIEDRHLQAPPPSQPVKTTSDAEQ